MKNPRRVSFLLPTDEARSLADGCSAFISDSVVSIFTPKDGGVA